MKFKEFILFEAGHTFVMGQPLNITVMSHGKPAMMNGVTMVDPRFELCNIPHPEKTWSKGPKFMGEVDFSLPVIGRDGKPAWFNSQRASPFEGIGSITRRPQGYPIQNYDWGNAHVSGSDGKEVKRCDPNSRGSV